MRKPLAFIAFFGIWLVWGNVLVLGDGPRPEAQDAATGLARVDSLLNQEDPGAAVTEARRQFAKHGQDPLYGWQIEGRLGLALLRNDRAGEALPHLEAALAMNPGDPEMHRNLALALSALGRRGRALTEYGLVVELAPGNHVARLEYGRMLQDFRDYKRALVEFETARRLCNGCVEADRALANLHMESGDFAAAVAPLERLLAVQPLPEIDRLLLAAFSRSGNHEGLLHHLDDRTLESLSAEEANLAVEAETALGLCGYGLALVAAAGPTDTGTGSLPPRLRGDAMLWGRVAIDLLECERYEEGLQAARLAVDLAPDNVVFRNNLVVLLLRLGRDGEADREWKKVLALDPTLADKEPE